MTETVEKNILIAERVPPGDQWKMGDTVYPSLIEMLNAFHKRAAGKYKAYRLEPSAGVVYAITESIQEVPQPKKYDLYGDYD
jgi:hypothetical protein